MGSQKLLIYLDKPGDGSVADSSRGEAHEELNDYDYLFQANKAKENYLHNSSQSLEWLDRILLERIEKIRNEYRDQTINSFQAYQSQKEIEIASNAFLVIQLQIFDAPMIYEDISYHNLTWTSYPQRNTNIFNIELEEKEINLQLTRNEEETKESDFASITDQQMLLFLDFEFDQENPVEKKYSLMSDHDVRQLIDPNLKPNIKERSDIEEILQSSKNHLKKSEQDLLWNFRYFLTENPKALTKFLLCVRWTIPEEVQEVQVLLKLWSERAPIDVADALKLLGRTEAYRHEIVRAFAVDTLRTATDSDLLMYLLQLVQALRYEPHHDKENNSSSLSQLAQFLIDRAVGSLSLANFFFWYLQVELSVPSPDSFYTLVMNKFIEELKKQAPDINKTLNLQEKLVRTIAESQREARIFKGKKDQKEEQLRNRLTEKWKSDEFKKMNAVPIPLDPSIVVSRIIPRSTFMFKSAMYPAVVEFVVASNDDDEQVDEETRIITSKKREKLEQVLGDEYLSSKTYRVIFKSGDDLRQDQLILQMIMLMDNLLKKIGLDLKLTPYRVLATSVQDGLMEFVSESFAISAVLEKHHNSIAEFLLKHNPDKNDPTKIASEAMNTFIKSCAGYCVITYILGIGDRHLDNIMMLKQGNLFHIDFGFIFGRDPKPYPPPFRFTKEMADAMGGTESENYAKFRTYCFQAYNLLRKSTPLILNLLELMAGAGIDELAQDTTATLEKIEKKMRPEFTNEEAEQFFNRLLEESLNAIAPRLMDFAHQIAVARR